MRKIMVQWTEQNWTIRAMHLASALGRNTNSQVVLLRLIPVTQISYLGTQFGQMPLTKTEKDQLKMLADIACQYMVDLSVLQMQSHTTLGAIVDAANNIDALTVFADVPDSGLPFIRDIQTWWLKKQLAHNKRQLFTLEPWNDEPGKGGVITIRPSDHPISK